MKYYRRQEINIDGCRISYRTNKSHGRLPSLMMVTGWPAACSSMLPLMNEMEGQINCFAPDLPGYGNSDAYPGANHDFKFMAGFLKRFQEQVIQTEQVDFFGYSIGGVHTLCYAYYHPENIRKAAILSAPYDGIDHFNRLYKKAKKFYYIFVLCRKYPFLLSSVNRDWLRDYIIEKAFSHFYLTHYPAVQKIDHKFVNILLKETQNLNPLCILQTAVDLSKHDFSQIAPSLNTPFLVIAPEKDEAVISSKSEHLAKKLLKKADFYLVKNENHAVVLHNPRPIAERIISYLKNPTNA